uniref:Uncharacterized protein n=1 Tax=Physcomitrium patens TaxID=3218 RepID=A0A2K1KH33_PHYPA|nr:hypothetical protein PHYPA_009444 [Physcomitrium patens]
MRVGIPRTIQALIHSHVGQKPAPGYDQKPRKGSLDSVRPCSETVPGFLVNRHVHVRFLRVCTHRRPRPRRDRSSADTRLRDDEGLGYIRYILTFSFDF